MSTRSFPPYLRARRLIHPRRATTAALVLACLAAVAVVVSRSVETTSQPLLPVPLVFDLIRERTLDDRHLPGPDDVVRRLGHLVSPITGARPSRRASHLPGADRSYRGGTHEGLDYYAWDCGVNVVYGTPVRAVADGLIVRADRDFVELSPASRALALEAARVAGPTDPRILDPLHGRQVWVLHTGGILTRYTHLSAVNEGIDRGTLVRAGQVIGAVGNSGTSEGALGSKVDPHLHLEIYLDWRHWWRGLTTQQVRMVLGQILRPSSR